MRSLITLLTVASVATAGPVLAQNVDPVGKYEFTTTVEGQTVAGTIEVAGTEGAWTAVLLAEGQGEIPISAVEVDGSIVTLIGEIPEQGELLIELEMDGDEFTGNWALGFDGGEIQGRRVTT